MKAKLTVPKEYLDNLIRSELGATYGMRIKEVVSITSEETAPADKHLVAFSDYEIEVELSRTRRAKASRDES